MAETGSFRPSVYSAVLAGLGEALVFKTSALNHSAIPPANQIKHLAGVTPATYPTEYRSYTRSRARRQTVLIHADFHNLTEKAKSK